LQGRERERAKLLRSYLPAGSTRMRRPGGMTGGTSEVWRAHDPKLSGRGRSLEEPGGGLKEREQGREAQLRRVA
jgi:hypothetical protein